jgi:hypothetical protein
MVYDFIFFCRYVESNSNRAIHSPFGNHVLPVLTDNNQSNNHNSTSPNPQSHHLSSQGEILAVNHPQHHHHQQPHHEHNKLHPAAREDTDIESTTTSHQNSQEPKNLLHAYGSNSSPAKVA